MSLAPLPLELSLLLEAYPLPPGWATPECFIDRVAIGGTVIELAGLVSAATRGTDVTGSAAELSRVPVERAYYELVERTSVLDALEAKHDNRELFDADHVKVGMSSHVELFPESPDGSAWRYARSNGVAVGATWQDAARAALAELVERDRILRSWYGETCPELSVEPSSQVFSALATEYECQAYFLPESPGARSRAALEVAAVFAFPKVSRAPFALGMGAGRTRAAALAKAERECLQGIGFLWDEAIPTAEPDPSPTPGYHQELYLLPEMQQAIRRWLRGEHQQERPMLEQRWSSASEPRFADLTPENLLGRLHVAKAIAADELPLTFGRGHPRLSAVASGVFAVHPLA